MPSVARYTTPSALSSNLASTYFNSLANGSESATAITYDNSTDKSQYQSITIKLGSIAPGASGGIRLRVLAGDGTNTPDQAGGDTYWQDLKAGTSAKVVIFPLVRMYPRNMLYFLINNSGVALPASGNEFYESHYNEEIASA
jgi:hypothetical protein